MTRLNWAFLAALALCLTIWGVLGWLVWQSV